MLQGSSSLHCRVPSQVTHGPGGPRSSCSPHSHLQGLCRFQPPGQVHHGPEGSPSSSVTCSHRVWTRPCGESGRAHPRPGLASGQAQRPGEARPLCSARAPCSLPQPHRGRAAAPPGNSPFPWRRFSSNLFTPRPVTERGDSPLSPFTRPVCALQGDDAARRTALCSPASALRVPRCTDHAFLRPVHISSPGTRLQAAARTLVMSRSRPAQGNHRAAAAGLLLEAPLT